MKRILFMLYSLAFCATLMCGHVTSASGQESNDIPWYSMDRISIAGQAGREWYGPNDAVLSQGVYFVALPIAYNTPVAKLGIGLKPKVFLDSGTEGQFGLEATVTYVFKKGGN